jgi:putative N-acetylmannosamine-6-phosphate epimerase
MDKIRSVEPGWLHTTDSVPNYSIKRASSVVCTRGLASSPHEALEALSDMVRVAGMDGAVGVRIESVSGPGLASQFFAYGTPVLTIQWTPATSA